MENKKGKNILIGVLLTIVIILVAFIILVLTNTISLNLSSNTNNGKAGNDSTINNSTKYNQETFKKIVDDELYILFGYNSLSELTNQRKLTLAFNLIEKEYSTNGSDIYSTVQSVSKEKVDEAFNKTSISKLGITHQDFDVYKLNNDTYNRNNEVMSKRNLFHCNIKASKVSNFEVKDNKYIVSVKHMFPDGCEGVEGYYGTYLNANQTESNFVVKAYTGVYTDYIDPQKYLDDNYDSIKDKLDTYIYTFEVNNGKIDLVDFSINK